MTSDDWIDLGVWHIYLEKKWMEYLKEKEKKVKLVLYSS